MAKKRTEMRSKADKKLYAVRDEQGEFMDIQTYQRAHAGDMRFDSKAEMEEKAKKAAAPKKAVKKKKMKKAKPAKKTAKKTTKKKTKKKTAKRK